MTRTLNTCRLCKQSNFESTEHLFHYSVRHYVHASCGLKKWGEGFFDRIFPADIGKIPYFVLRDLGFLEAAKRRMGVSHDVN